MSDEKNVQSHPINYGQILALRGLRLPAITFKGLQTAGIYCQPAVSIEHQHLARRYVLPGVESGGAVADLGAYCGFVDEDGQAMSWLQTSRQHRGQRRPWRGHFRRFRPTTDVTRAANIRSAGHAPLPWETRRRANGRGLKVRFCFTADAAHWRWISQAKMHGFRGTSGSRLLQPQRRISEPASQFQDAVVRITTAASRVGCRHCHLLQPGTLVSGQCGA